MEWDITFAAADYLREVRAQELAGCRTHTATLRGAPAKRMPAFARAERIGPVVMTSHARGGLRRLMQRSLTEALVWGGPPIYVVPAPIDVHTATTEPMGAPGDA